MINASNNPEFLFVLKKSLRLVELKYNTSVSLAGNTACSLGDKKLPKLNRKRIFPYALVQK